MKNNFCTISTKSHLFKCFALADSIAPFNGFLNILVVDVNAIETKNVPVNVKFHFLNDLNSELAQKIKNKYAKTTDKLRWSLKSIYLLHLLQDFEKVICIDNDIFFYNDFRFLFDQLDKNTVLLTPHHYKRDALKDQNWFEANFRVGLYNAGFVAVNTEAKKVLEWWANACLYRCEKNYWRGLFDDQKYLDLFPIIEPKTRIIRHEGCNVAAWNNDILKRSSSNGKHLINHSYSLVFYHFNNYSLQVLDENDLLFQEYITALKKYKEDLSSMYLKNVLSFTDKIKLGIWTILNKMNS